MKYNGLSLIALLTVLLLSCSNSRDNSNTNYTAISLEKTRWEIDRLQQFPADSLRMTPPVYIQLDSGRLKGFAGCNSLFGSYLLSGDTLRFDPVGSTKKFCNAGMEIENALIMALHATNRYRFGNEQLELLNNDSLLATFRFMKPEGMME